MKQCKVKAGAGNGIQGIGIAVGIDPNNKGTLQDIGVCFLYGKENGRVYGRNMGNDQRKSEIFGKQSWECEERFDRKDVETKTDSDRVFEDSCAN